MNCPHSETIILQHEGDVHCLQCNRTIECSLTYEEIYPSKTNPSKDEKECSQDFDDVTNVCSKFNLFDSHTLSKVYEEFLKLKHCKERKFNKCDLITFCVYHVLKNQAQPRTMKQISKASHVSSKKLWKLERKHEKAQFSTASELLDTYHKHLGLSHADMNHIVSLITNCKLKNVNFAPSTISAGLVYFYMKNAKMKTSMEKIAKTYGISIISVNRFDKYYQRMNK